MNINTNYDMKNYQTNFQAIGNKKEVLKIVKKVYEKPKTTKKSVLLDTDICSRDFWMDRYFERGGSGTTIGNRTYYPNGSYEEYSERGFVVKDTHTGYVNEDYYNRKSEKKSFFSRLFG